LSCCLSPPSPTQPGLCQAKPTQLDDALRFAFCYAYVFAAVVEQQ